MDKKIESVLKDISKDQIEGENIRYEPIYDQLKEIRRSDNPDLPYGIWESKLKTAEWEILEKKSLEVLQNKSKEFQVLLWLGESWIVKNDFAGLNKSLELINKFCEKYWDKFYPKENEFRLTLAEWMDRKYSDHILNFKLSQRDDRPIHLASWRNCLHMNKMISRDKSVKNELLELYKIDLNEFRNLFNLNSESFVEALKAKADLAFHQINTIIKFWDERIKDETISFKLIRNALNEIKTICENEYIKKDKPSEKEITQEVSIIDTPLDQHEPKLNNQIKNREDIYSAFRELNQYLEQTEPQNPAHSIINMVLKWKDMDLLNIINSVKENPEEHKILYMLTGSS